MSTPLRALIVEDVERDAELLVRELTRGGFEVTYERVDRKDTMTAALSDQQWDIVLSDYSMPNFGAPQALALVKELRRDLPFIIVSGTVAEDTAVEAMRAGAHDFMAKGSYARLIPAVKRELRESVLRAEQIKMREQLSISERMASLGTLAAGVAHEINNPLATVMLNLEMATSQLNMLTREIERQPNLTNRDVTEARLEHIMQPLQSASESAERIRRIARDLRFFSRSDEETMSPVDVHQALESAIRLAQIEMRHRAVLIRDFGEVRAVIGNEARLVQAFLNILINAAQAIPEGNTDANFIRVATKRRADNVAVEISDTGTGIPQSMRSRIFEPFFTSKPIGIGTGLGLSICHRIVMLHRGKIEVESEMGQGTLFRILLPAAAESTAENEESSAVKSSKVGNVPRKKLLVVDDEPALGAAIQRLLSISYDVCLVNSGRQALTQIQNGSKFDAILCDLMMPEMTGMELYGEISGMFPDLARKIVFMSGGAFTHRAKVFLEQVQNPRVEKPFDLATLSSVLEQLDSP